MDDAIQWAGDHAEIVLVLLSSGDEPFYSTGGVTAKGVYSAGSVPGHEYVDGARLTYPAWPPSDWRD